MMRERFAKLLLGEDMSGSGKGVCTAVTVSNSITNLYGLSSSSPLKYALFSKQGIDGLACVLLQRLCLDRV